MLQPPRLSLDGAPLAGLVVLDFTQVFMGPAGTQLLADFGATVIKVERPPTGDLARRLHVNWVDDDRNAIFASVNRGKRSLAIDVGTEAGLDTIVRLLPKVDVIITNLRPGAMERLGLGYEAVSRVNPAIIYASGSAFGPVGPLAHLSGMDSLAQAMSGVMARTPEPDQGLSIYPTTIGDYCAGMHLVQGILLALLARDRNGGRGQRIDVSLFGSLLALQVQEATSLLMDGIEPNWSRMPLTGVFEAADGPFVLVGAFHPDPVPALGEALDDQRLRDLPAETDLAARRSEVHGWIAEVVEQQARDHWLARLEAQGLLAAPVLTLQEALDHEQTGALGLRLGLEGGGRHVETLGPPMTLSDAPGPAAAPPPHVGEHSRDVLATFGLSDDEIDQLRNTGVIHEFDP